MSLSGLICRRLLCFFLFKETFGMRHWRQLFLLWSETCPQPEQRLFLMSFLVLFIAATRWRECGALTKRRRGVEKPFVKANVPSRPSRKRRERAHGSSSQARRLRRGGRTKPDRAVPNLSAKGGISSVKRGKKTSDLRSFCYEQPSLFLK